MVAVTSVLLGTSNVQQLEQDLAYFRSLPPRSQARARHLWGKVRCGDRDRQKEAEEGSSPGLGDAGHRCCPHAQPPPHLQLQPLPGQRVLPLSKLRCPMLITPVVGAGRVGERGRDWRGGALISPDSSGLQSDNSGDRARGKPNRVSYCESDRSGIKWTATCA
eukprot:3467499-Rhodomonas_salina.2